MEFIENKTSPGAPPQHGDWCVFRIGSALIEREYIIFNDPPIEEIQNIERRWRTDELQATDWIVPITDHPQHAAYMAYRQALRDWPSTDAFPDTRPELGA